MIDIRTFCIKIILFILNMCPSVTTNLSEETFTAQVVYENIIILSINVSNRLNFAWNYRLRFWQTPLCSGNSCKTYRIYTSPIRVECSRWQIIYLSWIADIPARWTRKLETVGRLGDGNRLTFAWKWRSESLEGEM